MSYPKYVIAPTKATWENGFPLPAEYLSLEADAKKVADGVGGTLINGVDFFKGSPISFVLDAADPRQPWMITLNGSTTFAGIDVARMYGPNNVNGGGEGNPGEWVTDQVTKVPAWAPTAPPPPPVVIPPPHTGPSDADIFAGAVQGATTMTTQAFDTETLYWLRAIGSRLGIAPPAA